MSNQFNNFGGNNNNQAPAPFQMSGQPAGIAAFGGVGIQPPNQQPFAGSVGQSMATFHPFASSLGGLSDGPQFDTTLVSPHAKATDLGHGAIRSVRVISCNFCEMVEQNNMGFRPFVSNVTKSGVLDQIPQFVREQRMGANFKSESMNGIVSELVTLSPSVLGTIPLVNGWNIKRYSFTIMAEVVRNNNNTQQYMLEGFTDTPELSTNNGVKIAPDMVLYVNNITSFAQRTNLINGGLSMVPVESYNIISSDPFSQNTITKNIVTQRPYDIANMGLSGVLAGNAAKFAMDARSSIATDPKTSNLSNNNPASYVAKIINEGISAMDNSNTDSLFGGTTLRNMLDSVVEPSMAKNGFLQALGRISRDFNTAVSSFTWSDLCKLDLSLSNPHCPYLNVYPLLNRAGFLPGSGYMCDDINGSGHEQVFAQMIANGVADLMSRCEATEVSVMATNHSGMDEVEVTGMRCYDQNKLTQNVDLFKMCFRQNIMNMLNTNLQFSYNVALNATVWGETFVKINLGSGTQTFLLPNFANGMYSPVLTNDKMGTEEVSRHLLNVSNHINTEQYNMSADLQASGLVHSAI